MLRAELNHIVSAFRSDDYQWIIGKKPRGKIYMETVHLATYKADSQLVGTVLSIPVYRKLADLGEFDGAYEYYDDLGNFILTGIW